ncbi:MAG TPA: thiamine phosphate synthase [Actinomycetota bacterium]
MARLGPRDLDLCVITTGTLVSGRAHAEIATAGVEGGATAVQLRAPELDDDRLRPLAEAVARICQDGGVLFLVNDRVEVAVACDARGAHVGQADGPDRARARLGPARILGVSVSSSEEAEAAEAAGADYLGVTVWETATKSDAVPIGLEGLRAVSAATSLPVVGVGGIDETNAADVIRAGGAGVAVIGAVATAADPVAAVRRLRSAVDEAWEER